MQSHEQFAEMYEMRRAAEPPVVPHIIGGAERYDGRRLLRENPAYPDTTASVFHDAPAELASEAVAASREAQAVWRRLPLVERVERVGRAIPELQRRSLEFATRIALETGKPFGSCVSEVEEVLAFLTQYTRFSLREEAFSETYPAPAEGVANLTVLKPYGVFGVITPFNYPFALSAGPMIAALLAGNGVVIKSASRGPWSGYSAYEITTWMDLPAGLVSLVHGSSAISRAVIDAGLDGAAFTGSVAVGMSIVRQYASGPYAKPVIAEMGGKNPLIISQGADLEAAVPGIMFSSFDISGQKCSSLSRILITPGMIDELVDLLRPHVEGFVVGPPDRADSRIGPVVSGEAVAEYHRILDAARAEGFEVVTSSEAVPSGHMVRPALIVGVPAGHWLATEEHFLPILTISEVPSFRHALEEANRLDIGLTAGLCTGDKSHAEAFVDEMHAGSITVNVSGHATTGWWPGLSTFGGWKASGSTGKQGYGKSYVQQFARQQSSKVPAEWRDLLSY